MAMRRAMPGEIDRCDADLRKLSEVRRTMRELFDAVNTEGVEWVKLGEDIDAALDVRLALMNGTARGGRRG